MLFIFQSKPYFVSVEPDRSFEHRTQLKFVLASDQIYLLIGDVVEDIGRDLYLLGLDIPINIDLLSLQDILCGHDGRQHLRGDIDPQRGSLLRKRIRQYSYGWIKLGCFVSDESFEGLNDGLPTRGARIEEVETDDGDDEDFCLKDSLLHGWLRVLDEQSQDGHEVVVAVVDYLDLNWGHLCY